MADRPVLGFIGLGVMGSRMSANLIRRSGATVVVYDPVGPAVRAATDLGAEAGAGVADVAERADVVFLSLPGIAEVDSVCGELVTAAQHPSFVVDMSTSDVARTRKLASRMKAGGVALIDAPVARTRQAAEEGTLLIMVGATESQFAAVRPYLSCMGSDVVHVGGTGSGQVVKILNNMVLLQNMNALAEALAIGRAAGVDGTRLFETLKLGSADSFALRRTATATMIPDKFPAQAFPVTYAIKDLALALRLAEDTGITAAAARQTMGLLERTRDAGYGDNYYPVMIRLVDGRG
jgi:3-hydroxyisobutyrate dehydrogenase-like beta-hydroxyacid dehydrogenase